MRASNVGPLTAAGLLVGILALAAAAPRDQASPRPPASPSSEGERTEDERDREERLQALPYATWAPREPASAGRAGVTRHRRDRAWPGLNLFPLTTRAEAWLVDMEGVPVHVWASLRGQPPDGTALPDMFWGWSHVAVDGDGSLYAVVRGHRLLKLDSDSRVVWEAPLSAHHDVSVGADGSVYTLTTELRVLDRSGRRRLVLDNDVVRLDKYGNVRERTSLLDVLLSDRAIAPLLEKRIGARLAAIEALGLRGSLERWSAIPATAEAARALLSSPWLGVLERALAGGTPPPAERGLLALLERLPGSPFDVLHGNAARGLDRAVTALGLAGDVLVSIRELDLIAVVDPRRRRVRWTWGVGLLDRQHDPSVMPNGHVLLFDNRPRTGQSRVVEMAPSSGRIVWSQDGFFSETQGACQALPNGNVLIVESRTGRALEVTRTGEVVWEFYNKEEEPGLRPTLRHMERIGGQRASRLRRRVAPTAIRPAGGPRSPATLRPGSPPRKGRGAS